MCLSFLSQLNQVNKKHASISVWCFKCVFKQVFQINTVYLLNCRDFFCLFSNFLNSPLKKFQQSDITQILSSVQKIRNLTCITEIANIKVKCSLQFVFLQFCFPPHQVVQIEQFPKLCFIICFNLQKKRNGCKTFFRKLLNLLKI